MIDANIISVFILAVFCCFFFSLKMLAVFQQCGYRIGEFLDALFRGKRTEIIRLSTYSVVYFIFLVFINIVFAYYTTTFSLLLFVFLTIPCGVYFMRTHTIKKVRFTNRCIRISVASLIFMGVFCVFVLLIASKYHSRLGCVFLAFIPILSPLFLMVGKIVNYPYDAIRYKLSKRACKKRLGKNKELIKIAITGSSGKTSVKNYLEKMLKTTYRVLATPLSFNTPLGVCKTVKEDICDYDIFIAEMGARRKNDIKELCNMVEPEIGIITTILPQHTKTLGGISGVKNAKYQLIEGLTKQKTGFFYNDNSHLYDLYKKADCNKRLVGEGGEVYFKNAVQLADGIDFELVVSGNTYKTFTPLIGFHNLKNVCIATAVALHVGVRLSKIMSVIQNLSPPKHRAEIIKTPTGVIVIDDGYNANIDGICSTANAVGQMEIGAGGKKIAVTCGIVELGKEAKELNFKVGEVLAKNFTQIIAIGINSIDVEKGVNGSGGNCLVLSDMKSVKRYLSKSLNKGDIVAFFNDLPDVYGI